jgi:hypothetical protein
MVDWHIQGPMITTCSCDVGCPCQFNSLPTRGYCHATAGMKITKGHFGSVKLDGMAWAAIFKWPKAIHEGNGEALAVISESGTPEQRDAVLKILTGQETTPGATIFNVFAGTLTKFHEPRFARIEFDADVAKGRGSFKVSGVTDAKVAPHKNPITGAEHRARITLPKGFEYHEAEVVASTVKTGEPMPLEWSGRHGHMAILDMGPNGPRHRSQSKVVPGGAVSSRRRRPPRVAGRTVRP